MKKIADEKLTDNNNFLLDAFEYVSNKAKNKEFDKVISAIERVYSWIEKNQ